MYSKYIKRNIFFNKEIRLSILRKVYLKKMIID